MSIPKTLLPYSIMKIEYNNLYTHFIFITTNRLPIIEESNRVRIEKYMTGIVNKLSEETLATIVADSTERFINDNKLCRGQFAWQQSASAFSVSKSDVDKVCRYILNQPEHHKKVSFAQEYESFINYYQKSLRWGL
jgi:putative transposase